MSLRIKLCGVRRVEDALVCARAGADEIGVVFAPQSKRRVTLAEAAAIRAALPSKVPLVGVFQDATLDELAEAAREVRLWALQLHGKLPVGLLDHPLASVHRLVAALHVDGPATLERLPHLAGYARVLLDGPKGGGSGTSFDWALALEAHKRFRGEVFIAGGLDPQSVAAAVRAASPDGVDVASGIEGPDGFKDKARVEAFVAAARAAAQG